MNVFLWIVAGLLAGIFLASGLLKLSRSKQELAALGQAWVDDFSARTVKAIGFLEVLAAIGLILPPILGIGSILAPAAAAGLVLLLLGAAFVHVRRKEIPGVAVSLVLLILALVITWGRFGPHSLSA